MSDNLPEITVPDPRSQAIIWGPCRLLNREVRPPDGIIGQRVAVRTAKEVDEKVDTDLIHPWNTAEKAAGPPDGSEEYASKLDRHQPGEIIGTVVVVGYTVGPDVEGSPRFKIDHSRPESFWYDKTQGDAVGNSEPIFYDPWWTGPIAWLLSDPQT